MQIEQWNLSKWTLNKTETCLNQTLNKTQIALFKVLI
jgi:hypothetical protein